MKLLTPTEHKQQEDLISQIYSKELHLGDVFIDVGANIGHHTWRMAQCVGEAGKGIAIEPVPDFREKLERVLAIKKIDWVEIFPVAVSDRCETEVFHYRKDFPGWSSLLEHHHHPEDPLKNYTPLEVQVSTLDTLLSETLTHLKFIKLDIEGSELLALKGAIDIISAFKPFIVLENVVSVAAELNGYPVSEFFTFFEEFECLLYDLFGNQISFEGYKSKSLNDLPIYFMAIPKDHPAANNPKAYYDLG